MEENEDRRGCQFNPTSFPTDLISEKQSVPSIKLLLFRVFCWTATQGQASPVL